MEPTISAENQTQLAALGITHEHVDQFNYQQYKYTTLKDALAQVRRDNVDTGQFLSIEKNDLPQHGITLELQDCFRLGQYQYSNLQDAMAQAVRNTGQIDKTINC